MAGRASSDRPGKFNVTQHNARDTKSSEKDKLVKIYGTYKDMRIEL